VPTGTRNFSACTTAPANTDIPITNMSVSIFHISDTVIVADALVWANAIFLGTIFLVLIYTTRTL
jgi:hypothetical protein